MGGGARSFELFPLSGSHKHSTRFSGALDRSKVRVGG
jgi:hypothetical protein